MKNLIGLYLFVTALVITACAPCETDPDHTAPGFMELPNGFPDIPFPADNAFSAARWELGKQLFYDPIMSSDSSVSCASCHKASLAFSDDRALSLGVAERSGTRNAPTLANVAYFPYFTREGGVPTLEMQILVPIQEHNEFDFNIVLLAERLNADSSYVQMSEVAYGRTPDPFVITRSLATFQRSLISGYSRYDHYQNYDDKDALSSSEIHGMQLYFSEKTQCSACHGGFNLTNFAFENNGLYEEYADAGRYRLTGEDADFSKFKVPSLRNVALTAPYMHDGSIASLEEVIDHYHSGGADNPHKSSLIRPLDLTPQDRSDLVAFLHTLTDEAFVSNPLFKK